MNKSKLLKNPILRNREDYKIVNPVGDTLEEIAEQDMSVQVGGTLPTLTVSLCGIIASKPLGNNGKLCTITKECMASCN